MKRGRQADRTIECKFDAGACEIVLATDRIPTRSFEVRVTGVFGDGDGAVGFCCGFTIYIEQGDAVRVVVRRLFDRLKHVLPTPLDAARLSELESIAQTWLSFNFGNVLQPAGRPET